MFWGGVPGREKVQGEDFRARINEGGYGLGNHQKEINLAVLWGGAARPSLRKKKIKRKQ